MLRFLVRAVESRYFSQEMRSLSLSAAPPFAADPELRRCSDTLEMLLVLGS